MLRALLVCSIAAVAVAPQEPASQAWSWRELPREGGPALRCALALPRGAAPDAKFALVLVLPDGATERASLEAGLASGWARGVVGADWIVACPEGVAAPADLDVLRRALTAEFDCETARVHVVGIGSGADRALALAAAQPELIASVSACAPTDSARIDRGQLDALVDTPLALVRGREDAREPVLALLERMLALGRSDVSLDFVSTVAHATPRASEGRVAQRLAAFRVVELARAEQEHAVRARLDEFHAAAAAADAARYFACLAPDAIFIGTDAAERWNVAQLGAYSEPYFGQGQGWSYVPFERHVYLSAGRSSAWFDERLRNAKYGEVRGSGTLRRMGTSWRITQYVMSFPVPNELSAELARRVGELGR